jgi:hypothetical protein
LNKYFEVHSYVVIFFSFVGEYVFFSKKQEIMYSGLLQINVPSFCNSAYWNSVIQNAIGCAIGSIIAIGISILIYWLTIRATNRAAREATKLREANQLRAFALMLELAMEMVSKQVESIKRFVSDVESHPSTFPIPAMNPLGRLKQRGQGEVGGTDESL